MPEASRRPPTIVLGSMPAGLGALRAIGRRRLGVFALPESQPLLRWSRYYSKLPGTREPIDPPTVETLEDAVAHSGLGEAVLLPCSDDWAAVVAEWADSKPGSSFGSAVAAPSTLALFQNKAEFGALLKQLAVPHPATISVDRIADLDPIPDSVFASAFLKPRDSQAFSGIFHRKAWWIPSRAKAVECLQRAEQAGLGMVVQQYVGGGPERHVFLDGYCSSKGVVEALFARRRLDMFPADFGNSTTMVSIELAEVSEAAESLRKIFSATSYRGIFSAEFKQDPIDGLFRLIEVNTRPWLFVDFAARCGVDVCYLYYLDALGQPLPATKRYRTGVRCINPRTESYRLRAEGAGVGRWVRWLGQCTTTLQPVGAFDDPLPGLVTAVSLAAAFVRHRFRPAVPG